jgi:DNA polymerase (family 10)
MPDSGDITNQEIANTLEDIAALLEAKGANPFRTQAYRKAAATVRQADQSIAVLARREGDQALQDLPNIGQGLARSILEIAETGESSQLRDLRSEIDPTAVLAEIPGIGEALARRVVVQLEISSLEELEIAAHDGRLAQVEGFGEGRVKSVKLSLAGMLSPAAQRRVRQAVADGQAAERPSVGTLLAVDQEYLDKAAAGKLRTIAPKRFNPEGASWLPILKTTKGPWSFTALFSNTKRAHELGKTDDWVVIYFDRDGDEDQCTVVSETDGPLAGRRVVRGRELDCRRYYEQQGML